MEGSRNKGYKSNLTESIPFTKKKLEPYILAKSVSTKLQIQFFK